MIRALYRPRTLAMLAVAGVVAACVISTTTRPVLFGNDRPPRKVTTPIKAHLVDGGVVVFASGADIGFREVTGVGQHLDATRTATHAVQRVPLDSVVGFETYERQVNPGRTLLYGVPTLALSTAGILALGLAIFGSCPTIYADSAGTQVLQAESFSNSIAPLLARRDLDRLVVVADAAGNVRLDVRNEAVETHYIDHLELVELRHRPGEIALPATPGGIAAVSDVVAPASARDAAGRDVRADIAASDDLTFATDDGLLARAIAGGPVEDHIDLTIARPVRGDEIALVLRVRSSLLSSAVLYDHMLGRPGPSALDWLGRDLSRITTLASLANWYADNFGLRVSIRDGDEWKPVARMLNFGPAAWRMIAVPLPRSGDDSLHVRLSFLADEYRIDQIGVGHHLRRLEQRRIPITRITDAEGRPRVDMAAVLRRADDRDLATYPGSRFYADFDVGTAPPGTRTFMVASEGYYTEWVRTSWLRAAKDSVPFSPSRTPIREVLRTWRAAKDTLEARFFVRRVPVV